MTAVRREEKRRQREREKRRERKKREREREREAEVGMTTMKTSTGLRHHGENHLL